MPIRRCIGLSEAGREECGRRRALTDQETTPLGPPVPTDLRQQRETIDIYGPIIHSAIFVLLMLAVTCIYIQRIDL